MIASIIRFILGFVEFAAVGDYPERLFNVLARQGIEVWGIRRVGAFVTAFTSLKNYQRIPKARRKSGARTRILARHGFPFVLRKYRFRIGAAIGIIVFFGVQCFLSTRVWNIEVVSNGEVDITHIMSVAEECGLYEGAAKNDLDTELLRSKMILQIPEASWMSVNVEGVKATVNVIKSRPTVPPAAEPCNLVADRDGVITAIEVRRGKIEVSLGQTVTKGELLVSGITEYADGTSSVCHAEGTVTALTEHEISAFEPFIREEKQYGEPKSRYVLSVFGLKIPLYLGGVKGDCEREVSTLKYRKNGAYLPVFAIKKTYTPYETVTVEQNINEVTERAEKKLAELISTEAGDGEYKVLKSFRNEDENGVTLNVTISNEQNIAKENFLLISDEE